MMSVCVTYKDGSYLEANIKGIKFDYEDGTIEIIGSEYGYIRFDIEADEIVSVHVVDQPIPDRKDYEA